MKLAGRIDGKECLGSTSGKPEYEPGVESQGRDDLNDTDSQQRWDVGQPITHGYLGRHQDAPRSYSWFKTMSLSA